jgi:hypothetical protein
VVKLTVEIKPDTAVPVAKISVDGKPISGPTVDITLDPAVDKKTVHVQVQATGFKDATRDLDVFARDSETSVSFELEPTRGGRPAGGTATPSGEAGNTGGGAASGGSTGGGSTGGGSTGGGNTGGGNTGGKGSGSKGKGNGKGSGKSGLIDI